MKELIVISGKGGAGKTSILAAFAALAENKLLCDADVDAADLHLIADPQIDQTHDFVSGHTATIDGQRCSACGLCRDMCRFAAIAEDYRIDPIACEGCGVCAWFCPEKAIDFPANTCGQWFISSTRFGPMVHARLAIAEENSGKLVTRVRTRARELASTHHSGYILTDGPPGTGCPAIASITGADAVLVVIEPSKSSLHDAKRVFELAEGFNIPVYALINKHDIHPDTTREIEAFLKKKSIPLVGRIPFEKKFVEAMIEGKSIYEYDPGSEIATTLRGAWKSISA